MCGIDLPTLSDTPAGNPRRQPPIRFPNLLCVLSVEVKEAIDPVIRSYNDLL